MDGWAAAAAHVVHLCAGCGAPVVWGMHLIHNVIVWQFTLFLRISPTCTHAMHGLLSFDLACSSRSLSRRPSRVG
ncbi:hypothetical protein IWX92DRAFT_353804 [Phyllosticta citricarpa]